MAPDVFPAGSHAFEPGVGQVVLSPPGPDQLPTEQVRSLYWLSDPGLSELGLEQLLDELLVRTQDALRVDTVAILLLDDETSQLVARAAKGIEEEVEQGVRIPIGEGFAGRIAAERVAIFIADVNHADILNPILREKGIRSLLGVPLIVGLSFEVIKWAGRNRRRRWVQAVMYPGLQLQRLTTREPDLDQLAVSIAALQAVLAVETPGEASAEELLGVEVVA